jgi:LysM repeat protein/serine/threonine protein phosphatase PrpC
LEEDTPLNFSCESVKSEANAWNEDFYFELATTRGHLFIVLDFSSHDYTNLNETLKRRVETIVESFSSLSGLSPQMLLGCIAKEINNCVHDLGHKFGGEELLCTAAICLISHNQLVYLTYGDARINIFTGGQLLLLNGSRFQVSTVVNAAQGEAQPSDVPSEQMGKKYLETPLTTRVQSLNLQDEDVVLILTAGLEEGLTPQKRLSELLRAKPADPKKIGKALITGAAAKRNDRTLVVIGGPYEQPVTPDWNDLQKSVTSLAQQVSGLADNDQRREKYVSLLQNDLNKETKLEQRISQRIDAFKDEIRGKAARIDLLESEERLKRLEAELAGKAETADVLALQRDMLQVRIQTKKPTQDSVGTKAPAQESATSVPPLIKTPPVRSTVDSGTKREHPVVGVRDVPEFVRNRAETEGWFRAYILSPLGLLMLLAIGVGVLIGVWVSGRANRLEQAAWVVRTSGDQLRISRQLDEGEEESFTVKLAQPFTLNGEQRFSTFAEVQNYVERVKATQAAPPVAAATEQARPTTESGLAVPETSSATTKEAIPRGDTAAIPRGDTAAIQRGDTAAIQRGDTIATLAARYRVTQSRLRQLNPGIKRWTEIKAGQRIAVPSSNPVNLPAVAAPSPQAPSPQAENNSAVGVNEVKVGSGDSLDKLARRYKATPTQLKELNPAITNWLRIKRGQTIFVPSSPVRRQLTPSPTQ